MINFQRLQVAKRGREGGRKKDGREWKEDDERGGKGGRMGKRKGWRKKRQGE